MKSYLEELENLTSSPELLEVVSSFVFSVVLVESSVPSPESWPAFSMPSSTLS